MMVKAVHFKVIHFLSAELQREVVLIYALGDDGVIREFSNNKWTEFPIYLNADKRAREATR